MAHVIYRLIELNSLPLLSPQVVFEFRSDMTRCNRFQHVRDGDDYNSIVTDKYHVSKIISVVFATSIRFHDPFNLTGRSWPPVQVAVDFNSTDVHTAKFIEADVAPFGVVEIVVEDRIAEEEAVGGTILGHVPITAAEEEVFVDDSVTPIGILGRVERRELSQTFFAGFVPHVVLMA